MREEEELFKQDNVGKRTNEWRLAINLLGVEFGRRSLAIRENFFQLRSVGKKLDYFFLPPKMKLTNCL